MFLPGEPRPFSEMNGLASHVPPVLASVLLLFQALSALVWGQSLQFC